MKKQKVIFGFLLSTTMISGNANASFWNKQGSGSIETRSFDAKGFDAISVAADALVEVKPGETAVAISLDDNLFDYLDVQVKDGRLEVSGDWRMRPSVRPKILVTLPNLKEVKTTGDVKVQATLDKESPSLTLDLGGSSHAAVKATNIENLTVDAGGSAVVSAEGKVQTLILKTSGNFHGDLEDLEVGHASVKGSGSTTLRFGSVGTIDGKMTGLNSVTYKKPPQRSSLQTR